MSRNYPTFNIIVQLHDRFILPFYLITENTFRDGKIQQKIVKERPSVET